MSKTDNVIAKLDKLLEDDDFTTRIGLKFMTAVMRDALQVIGEIAIDTDKVKELDKAFTTFMNTQAKMEEKAEAERTKWRWATITPVIGVVVIEIAGWILRKP